MDLFLFALVLFITYKIGRTLIIFALALIFAHLLSPVWNSFERIHPEKRVRECTRYDRVYRF